jgi:hypothetical protein
MGYMEPSDKRVIAFFDCQNLFNACKKLWGYSHPNFDPIKLSALIAEKHRQEVWRITGIRLYTGIHSVHVNKALHDFWDRKLLAAKNSYPDLFIFTSQLRYTENIAREKGVDVRIALDLVRMARKN